MASRGPAPRRRSPHLARARRGRGRQSSGMLPLFLFTLVAGLAGFAVFLHRRPPPEPVELARSPERANPARSLPRPGGDIGDTVPLSDRQESRESLPRSSPTRPQESSGDAEASRPGKEAADLAARESAPFPSSGREPGSLEPAESEPSTSGGEGTAPAVDPEALANPEPYEEPFDPLVDPLAGLPDDPGANAPETAVESKEELPRLPTAHASRLFTLSVEGTLNGIRLSPNDPHTWARIGYFLQQEAGSRFYLVYPGGFVPIVRKVRADGRTEEFSPTKGAQPPAGASPVFRLALQVEAGAGGDILLYGEKLASKYTCNITCRLEGGQGNTFRFLQEIPVSVSINPGRGAAQRSVDEYAQMVFHAALDKLVEKLARLPLFRTGMR